ncbi:predicted protein [Streptomyces viridosporus ATCC 14672]|uniref:Predicted protein n=1 Tax=Streptomyces viridosporus (strain ATCC 14672 / DSM 40746 / JCM 4963 / KCTC 9882 / NRRL B-12104 / FH 1290) TaxID=566461 RepID=D6A655_STRV1|nr:predicted protein [Streptomyces viridosporus ATCC 14672]
MPDAFRPCSPRSPRAPPRVGAFPAGHVEDPGRRSPRPVRHRDAYLHPTAFLRRAAPGAQPDHRVSDLPHGRPPKRAVRHLSAGTSQPSAVTGCVSCVYRTPVSQITADRGAGSRRVWPDVPGRPPRVPAPGRPVRPWPTLNRSRAPGAREAREVGEGRRSRRP